MACCGTEDQRKKTKDQRRGEGGRAGWRESGKERSSRSVCSNLAEAFRKRVYEKAFISKLTDSEGEAAETQVWLDYSVECRYISEATCKKLFDEYEKIIGMLVNMHKHPEKWSF